MNNSALLRIAIDGPSGVGKSTAAKALAKRLGIVYIDTGAMYRAIGVKAMRAGIGLKDEAELENLLSRTRLDFVYAGGSQRVLIDGEDAEEAIRTPEASRAASDVSTVPAVRRVLSGMQREMAARQSVAMDGRDIGTHVMPDAKYKFFLTGSPKVRAQRRYDELIARGKTAAYEQVLAEMNARDSQDTSRAEAPLRPAEDAVIVDTDDKDADQVLETILSHMEGIL